MYHGVAELPDGKKNEIKGTIIECADWADKMLIKYRAVQINIWRE